MRIHLGTLLLSAAIAMTLWGMAHGTSSIERSVDIPVVYQNVPDDVVITGHSVSAVNIRVLGSRAALRNVSPTRLYYRIDVSGAKPGPAVYEVDESRIELPRGARVVSRSPASIEVTLERRGRKAVVVRPDLEGAPAPGYAVTRVEVDPARAWLTGARGDVLRLAEVMTETIDVSGVSQSFERDARLSLGANHVWRETDGPVRVRVTVEPVASPETPEEAAQRGRTAGTGGA